jgi:hypothetical protein
VKLLVGGGAFLICAIATAGNLHPIVDLEYGYLFGATENGKWVKAQKAAKTLGAMPYRVYGLTQSLGQAKGGKPKASEEEVCTDVSVVSLSPNPKKGVIAVAGTWNALPRKVQLVEPTQKVYLDALRDFLKTKNIAEPKVKIDNIVRVDLDGDGEEEVLISATNYFEKDESAPMRSPAGSYSMVILRRVVSGKVETQLVEGEFHPSAFVRKDDSFDAPNVHKLIAVLDLDGDGQMEIVVDSRYYEGESKTIYRCGPKKCESLLSVGCGA